MSRGAEHTRNLAGSLVVLALLCLAALVAVAGGELAATSSNILYVDGTGGSDAGNDCQDDGDPCATIAHAIAFGGQGDEIRIAGGTYEEALIIGHRVTLKGGYEAAGWTRDITGHPTVVDAKGADDWLMRIDAGADVLVEGLTIQGVNHTSDWGGGVYANSATLVISATIVQNNKTSGGGGGIWVEAMGGPASLKVVASTVSNNQSSGPGGGILAMHGATVEVIDGQIVNNVAGGSGGGLEVSGEAGKSTQLTVEDSIIANNQAGPHGGALTVVNGKADLTNVLMYENWTTAGPASVLLASDSELTIMNSTMADNNPQGAQAIIVQSTDLEMTNSIMWNNALSIQSDPPCTECVVVNYSDVEGECAWCAAGQGNLNIDPGFVDAAGDKYRLRTGSPCIGKGTPTGAPAADIEGTPRDGQPDMGAYEWTGIRIFLPTTLRKAQP